jgi:hypothetical protein
LENNGVLKMAMKSLEKRIQRLEDIHEIQNLMSRYEYFHTADMQEETVELYARKTPGATAEIANWGVYEGIEGIKRLFLGLHRQGGEKALIGSMHMHTLTTPVIEVAADGNTAKGVWISPGHETSAPEGGKPQAMWAWLKYGVDFVKEDGTWKFWHFHVYPIFMTPYEKSWTEALPPVSTLPGGATIPDAVKPDKPTTYFWQYTTDVKCENAPQPPSPFETWDGKSVA